MNSIDTGNIITLPLICVDGVCHCDWRLTLQGCVESKAMTVINYINIPLSSLTIIIGVPLLVYRLIIQDHRLFDINISKGCFRPKPFDSMLLSMTIFNSLRLFSSIVLITDICPNMIFRSFMYEIPWQFGLGAFSLYLVGIAQTLADSHRVIANSWILSPKLIDIIGGTVFFAPFIISNIISLLSGVFAYTNAKLADTLTRLGYFIWCFYLISIDATVLISGTQLIRVLKVHQKAIEETSSPSIPIKNSIFKIRVVIIIICITLSSFLTIVVVYASIRETVIVSGVGSIILGTIWNLLANFAILGVEFIIVFNPHLDGKSSLGLTTSKTEGSGSQVRNSNYLSSYANSSFQESSSTGSNSEKRIIPENLSSNYADGMKVQQLQYQGAVFKHNNSQITTIKNQVLGSRDALLHSTPAARTFQQQQQQQQDVYYYGFNGHSDEPSFSHHDDDTIIVDDGETSEKDLVACISKK